MSFTTLVKNEVCSLEYNDGEAIRLLSGFVRNNYSLFDEKLILSSENAKIARFLFSLFKRIYGVNVDIVQGGVNNFNKKNSYNIIIGERVKYILNDLMVVDFDGNSVFLDNLFLNTDFFKRAYLSGCFLASGSVNDPKTSRYHLEFLVDRFYDAEFICSLLGEFYINSKIIDRDKGYMVYVKEAEKIGDFLRLISANNAVMYYEDIRIYRDHKNMTNRLNNCEQANIDKVFQTSNEQIHDIEKLKEYDMLDFIDEKLKEVCKYRLKYPESSLKELSEIISLETGNVITKSGLNHRFRKIKEIASQIKEK